MKRFIKVMLVCAALVASGFTVLAGEFGTTNFLQSGLNYSTYPTNSSGKATGNAVSVVNYSSVGFYFKGFVSNAVAATVGISVVRSPIANTPTLYRDWDTDPCLQLTIAIPAVTNYFSWSTNWDSSVIGPANYIGLSQLTNNFTSTNVIQSLDIGLVKKIQKISFP